MSPIDRETLHSKMARIRKNIKELKKLAAMPYEKYSKDIFFTAAAERLIHITIEAMLDIGSHIVAEESLGEPLEYRDIFKLLTKGGVLPKEKEEIFLNLAGLRNRIVHLYDEIDHKLLHQSLQNELDDFDFFLQAMTAYLRR